jgi:hypothetical protein
VAQLTVQQSEQGFVHRINTQVKDHAGGPSRMVDKIEGLLKRMASFEAASQR